MGLLGKKEGIVCCKCHVSHDKLLKKRQFADASKFMNMNEMLHCGACGTYFCSKCGEKAGAKNGDRFPICCPACKGKSYKCMEEYEW